MIDLPEGIRIGRLNEAKIRYVWGKVKDFDKMFCDGTKNDYEGFRSRLLDPDAIVGEVKNGLLILKNIVQGLYAEVHIKFWDKKLSVHTEICKDCLLWAFMQFELERIETFVPAISRAVRRFIVKRLGFKEEGIMRNKTRWNGMMSDVHFYSILRNEVL